jgi:hypothetical protein
VRKVTCFVSRVSPLLRRLPFALLFLVWLLSCSADQDLGRDAAPSSDGGVGNIDDSGAIPSDATAGDGGGNDARSAVPEASSDANDATAPEDGDPVDGSDAGSPVPDATSSNDGPPDAPSEDSGAGLESDANEGGPGVLENLCDGCGVDQKSCGGGCVSTGDPAYGCANEGTCRACNLAYAISTCGAHGLCAVASCTGHRADCNNDPSDGCEAELTMADNCGTCGNVCAAGQLCTNGACVTTSLCPFPLSNCGQRCVDVSNTPEECGQCGAPCPAVPGGVTVCNNGACDFTCPAGFTKCGTGCFDLSSDPDSCGICATVCSANGIGQIPTCSSGQCGTVCQPGWTACSSQSCTYLNSDPVNCGACGRTCGTTEICNAGTCQSTATFVVASGLAQPYGLAVDGDTIYFANFGDSTVNRVSTRGGPVTTLATGQAQPLSVAVDANNVYWSSNLGNALLVMPKDQSAAPKVVAEWNAPTGAIGAYGGNLYYMSGPYLYTVPSIGGTPQGIAAEGYTINSNALYYLASVAAQPPVSGTVDGIVEQILPSGTPSLVLTDQDIGGSGFAPPFVVGCSTFWAGEWVDTSFTPPTSGPYSPAVRTTNEAGPTQAALGCGLLSVGAGGVFFSTMGPPGGTLQAGGPAFRPTPLFSGGNRPNVVVVSGASIYWTDSGSATAGSLDGAIYRMPVPL